ncbi:MAG: ammonium transporter, partial [Lentisphaerae bacterium]
MAAPEAAPSAVANSPGVVAQFTVNNLWMMIAVTLVFIMHLGFATLEVGLTRAKNTVNILFKNIVIVAIGFMTYTILGFSLMYPANWLVNGWLGFSGLGIESPAGAAG